MFLSIRDLFVNYGALEVLKGVSLDIEEGKISLLLGANGSGKSTLLSTISGFNRPLSGTIWFEDKRIDGMTPENTVKLGISHVPEGRRVFPQMSVFDNLMTGAYLRKDKAGIKRDLEKTYGQFPVLSQRRRQQARNLSGGEQQALSISRALMNKPKLLLVDEPAQGLSPLVVNEVADIITGINQSGITILLVEHNLRLGLSLADKIYVLQNGKIAFEAKSTDLSEVEYAKKVYLGG